MRRQIVLAVILVVITSCRSGGIVERGFSSVPTGEHAFTARFQGPNGMSEENVRRNLLYHAARAAIERGDLYLIVGEIRMDRQAQWQPVQGTGPAVGIGERVGEGPDIGGSAAEPTAHQQSGMSYTRYHIAEASVTTFREKPQDARAREASALMDEIRGR